MYSVLEIFGAYNTSWDDYKDDAATKLWQERGEFGLALIKKKKRNKESRNGCGDIITCTFGRFNSSGDNINIIIIIFIIYTTLVVNVVYISSRNYYKFNIILCKRHINKRHGTRHQRAPGEINYALSEKRNWIGKKKQFLSGERLPRYPDQCIRVFKIIRIHRAHDLSTYLLLAVN